MQYTREKAINTLLESYRTYFNITLFDLSEKFSQLTDAVLK